MKITEEMLVLHYLILAKKSLNSKRAIELHGSFMKRIFYPEIEEVQVLDEKERGSGGFGSTGKN